MFDGTYAYQYDAWNRLCQVNLASYAQDLSARSSEPPPTEPLLRPLALNALVKHFTYDGMGRMVRIVSPFPDAAHADLGFTRSERLYYDGVRRIQEVVTDPVLNLGKSVEEGNSGAIDAKDENPKLDDKGNPIESEKDQTFNVYLEREYVWGPGDNGVDELLVQFDRQRDATWPITDAGGDIVALCDTNGSGGTARVVGEWAYDAYGEPIVANHPHAHAVLKCGHKGLFFDRLDAGVYDPNTGGEMERLVPNARGLYYARNRHHKPDWGRWLQQDPNATGLPVQADLGFHGMMLGAGIQSFSLGGHYGDGVNVYGYLRFSPYKMGDPSGLYTIAEGIAVHAVVTSLYMHDHPGCTISPGLPNGGGRVDIGGLKPDIINFTRSCFAEIKPLTPYGLATGAAQMGAYTLALARYGIVPDDKWVPSDSCVYVNGKPYKIMNVNGLIFYMSWSTTAETVVEVSSAALVVAYWSELKSVAGRLLAGGTEGALGGAAEGELIPALAGVGASEGAYVEGGVGTTTMTSSMGGY